MQSKRISLVIILLIAITLLSGCIDTGTDQEQTVLNVIGVSGETRYYNMSSLLELKSVEGRSMYQNTFGYWKDQGVYQGVLISVLAEQGGGIQEGDILIVSTRDNYTPQIFTYENIFPKTTEWNTTQGTMILAYEFNGSQYPEWKDGPRIAFLPPDENYSNADKANTSSLEALQGSAGARWSKYVNKLEFLRESERVTFRANNVNHTFSRSQVLNFPSIQGSGGYVTKGGTVVDPYNYTGVNLTYIVSSLIDTTRNFSVSVFASDYNLTFTRDVVFGNIPVYDSSGNPIGFGGKNNLSLVLAYFNESIPLEEGGPFMIAFIGSNSYLTDSWRWIRDVVFIEINYS